ncbi:MAG: DUF2441 domain-containing protein [Clostridia bacterium]|nr:DUF2441 domain-containing protein [Clostridia bacterium]
MTTELFHVVTGRRMEQGQVIEMDDGFATGVYQRVMEKKPLVDEILSHPEKYANASLDHHTDVAIRELALEQVRRERFPQYPSRMHSLYTSRTLEDAKCWFQWFTDWGRPTLQIVRLEAEGRVFTGNANLCFDGLPDQAENLRKALRYWQVGEDPDGERPIWETIVDGRIVVAEILHEAETKPAE